MVSEQKIRYFCASVEKLKDSMFRVAFAILKNHEDAEDAIGRTLLLAYEHLDDLKLFEKLKPWLFRILTNECYKIANGRHEHENIDDVENQVFYTDDTGERLWIWEAVMKLDEKYRSIVILFYFEDMSIRDIAKVLTLSEDNVKKRLSRAREKLRCILKTEGYNE